jgi:hypothetical protein
MVLLQDRVQAYVAAARLIRFDAMGRRRAHARRYTLSPLRGFPE